MIQFIGIQISPSKEKLLTLKMTKILEDRSLISSISSYLNFYKPDITFLSIGSTGVIIRNDSNASTVLSEIKKCVLNQTNEHFFAFLKNQDDNEDMSRQHKNKTVEAVEFLRGNEEDDKWLESYRSLCVDLAIDTNDVQWFKSLRNVTRSH